MYKRVILIFMVLVIIFSICVPFASAAEGETKSVQYYNYNGIIIPSIDAIWDKANYPYVFIVGTTDSAVYVYFLNAPAWYGNSIDSMCTKINGECTYYYASISGNDKEYMLHGDCQWDISDVKTVNDGTFIRVGNRSVWSNHDVMNTDNAYCYIYASEPVVDKLVEYETNPAPAAPLYDYGGFVVPNIESCESYDLDQFPYVAVFEASGYMILYLSDVPFVTKNGSFRTEEPGNYIRIQRKVNYLSNGYGWGSGVVKASTGVKTLVFSNDPIWINCDVYDTNGDLYYTSVPPVPVDPSDVGGGDSGGGGNVEVADITFFNNILRLFTSTFDAASGDEYFRFLIYFVAVEVAFGLFFFLTKGSRKL